MRTPSLLVAAAGCCVALLAGCDGDGGDSGEADDPSASPSASETTTTEPPPPAPRNGACYRLDERRLRAAHVEAAPVECKQNHTSRTYLVGKLRGTVVRSADSVDSTAISRTVDRRCSEAFGGHVGGDEETRALARVRYVWFVPSEEQFGRGANWFRCDVTADRHHGTPAQLPANTKGMLGADDALDTWGTCDQAGEELNAEADWRMCSQPHNWQAISVLPVGDTDASWPGVDSLRSRGEECESAVREHVGNATGALAFRWSYPTEEQWRAGRRHGLCWTRES